MSKKRNETHELTVHRMACLAGMLADHFAALCEKQAEVERLNGELNAWKSANGELQNELHDVDAEAARLRREPGVEGEPVKKALEVIKRLKEQQEGELLELKRRASQRDDYKSKYEQLHSALGDEFRERDVIQSETEILRLKEAVRGLGDADKSDARRDTRVNTRILDELRIVWKTAAVGVDFVQLTLSAIRTRESRHNNLLVDIKRLKEEVKLKEEALVAANNAIDRLKEEASRLRKIVEELREEASKLKEAVEELRELKSEAPKEDNYHMLLVEESNRLKRELGIEGESLDNAIVVIKRLREDTDQLVVAKRTIKDLNRLRRELGGEGVPIGQALGALTSLIGRANQRDEIKDKFESLLFALGDAKKEKGVGWAQDEIARLRRCASIEKSG